MGTSSEAPTKPPPPYVPPPPAPRTESIPPQPAFLVSCEEQKLIFLIESRVNAIWDSWVGTGAYPSEDTWSVQQSCSTENGTTRSTSLAFDTLVKDVIEEVIQEVLQYEPELSMRTKSYDDQIRLGQLTLIAQKCKLPRSKEELCHSVLEKTMLLIPPELLIRKKNSSISLDGSYLWRKKMRWAARPRDLVDEALVEELVDEDRLWLETGPEEAAVMEQLCASLIKRAVEQVVNAFRSVERDPRAHPPSKT